jgi:hypothetical protein
MQEKKPHFNFIGNEIDMNLLLQNLRYHFLQNGLLTPLEINTMSLKELLSKSIILVISDELQQRLLKEIYSNDSSTHKC